MAEMNWKQTIGFCAILTVMAVIGDKAWEWYIAKKIDKVLTSNHYISRKSIYEVLSLYPEEDNLNFMGYRERGYYNRGWNDCKHAILRKGE